MCVRDFNNASLGERCRERERRERERENEVNHIGRRQMREDG
jgi:hypothetical protein